ncbi:GIY-YIG nuclease family protein [Polynucleobacter sp. JS-Safj-400b-B2]|jgi:excinuclease UvrABC nuclease subunit|uniref:GIY-YIG nuclease family protein n=1 Tax=Polynucleobacter sp. JS-Safj-400b-B2 TaxID=2576921 RepID=UPI001C0B5408|nr:GIY-YIG nuclease family protein [Polynucleobacter sp. JS-Safj-400b-B2]MBU3626346.1 GIY-YIG nuclease family protein [Polynucleobacter sp. JS-Safj-400b-B2]
MATKKTTPLTKAGIRKISSEKPGVYDIKNQQGDSEYVGMAKKGRMQGRVEEHLPTSAKDPVKNGSKVKITNTKTKEAALKKEKQLIKSKQPPQNKKGK